MMSEGAYLLLVDTLRKKPEETLWRLLAHLKVSVSLSEKDESKQQFAYVTNWEASSRLADRVWGGDMQHILAKGAALEMSRRVNELEQAQRELDASVVMVGEPAARAVASSAPEVPTSELLTTHGLARFLLQGPNRGLTLDYGDDLRVRAEWAEESEARFARYLATEPDWNPPETEPERASPEPECTPRERDERFQRFLDERFERFQASMKALHARFDAARPYAPAATAESEPAPAVGTCEAQFGPAVELAAKARKGPEP